MERVGEARPWLWARQKWPVAAVALGRERESEGEERRGPGESERGTGHRGDVRAFQGDEEDARQAGGMAAPPCARAGHTPSRLAPGG